MSPASSIDSFASQNQSSPPIRRRFEAPPPAMSSPSHQPARPPTVSTPASTSQSYNLRERTNINYADLDSFFTLSSDQLVFKARGIYETFKRTVDHPTEFDPSYYFVKAISNR